MRNLKNNTGQSRSLSILRAAGASTRSLDHPRFLSNIVTCGVLLLLFPVLVSAAPLPAAQTTDAAASLEQILKDVSDYDGGKESEALWKLRDYVHAAAEDPVLRAECETKLLDFLKTSAPPLAKMAVCRHLRIIGSDKAVPVLQAMLSDEALSDMALYALQKIPGAEADKALVQALSVAGGPVKTSLIAAVGERESAPAVAELVSLLEGTEFAGAAATALGSIGGAEAERALAQAYPAAKGEHRLVVAAAMLQCAEKALAANNRSAATRLYETLSADATLAVNLRKAAAMGRISAAGNRGATILTDYLKGSDADMQEAAIARIRDVIEPEEIGPLCELMPGLAESSQIKLLAVFTRYPKEHVLPAIIQAAREGSPSVRLAAFKALESSGDHSVVPFLAETAAETRGPEKTAARRALASLKGNTVDRAIVDLMTRNPSEGIREELILAASERRIFSATSVISGFLSSNLPGVRIQSLKALRILGAPSDIPAVLNLLIETDSRSEQTEAEITTAALSQKTANPDDRSRFVKLRLAAEKRPEVLVRLLGTLPRIEDNSALPYLRQALRNNDADVFDAAVRALSSWPTSVAREDVFKLVQEVQDETHRLLAIRGLMRIIGLDKYRNPEAAVADLRQAAGFAWRPEEKKLVLGALVNFPCKDALNLAEEFLNEPALKAEAESAVNSIKQSLSGRPIRGR